jgi:hypothetical protein
MKAGDTLIYKKFFCRNVVFVQQQKEMNWYVEAHEGKA